MKVVLATSPLYTISVRYRPLFGSQLMYQSHSTSLLLGVSGPLLRMADISPFWVYTFFKIVFGSLVLELEKNHN